MSAESFAGAPAGFALLSRRTRPLARPESPGQVVLAVRLGARVATADVAGRPDDAAMQAWRHLRRHVRAAARPALQIAFDTGYGRGMHRALAS